MLSRQQRASFQATLCRRGLVAFSTILAGCSLGLPTSPDRPDAGVLDASVVDTGAPLACPPDPTGFQPREWHAPNPAKQGKCTEQQATDLAECAARQDQVPGACDAFKAANRPCYDCAVTSSLSATYGAFIDDGYLQINIPGCFSLLTGDVSGNSCGARVRANEDCAFHSCRCNDQPSFEACLEAAATGPCAAAYDPSCGDPFEAQCYGTELKPWYVRVIKLFCGT